MQAAQYKWNPKIISLHFSCDERPTATGRHRRRRRRPEDYDVFLKEVMSLEIRKILEHVHQFRGLTRSGAWEIPSLMDLMLQRPRVCILGGGFGDLYTALRLESLVWPDDKKPHRERRRRRMRHRAVKLRRRRRRSRASSSPSPIFVTVADLRRKGNMDIYLKLQEDDERVGQDLQLCSFTDMSSLPSCGDFIARVSAATSLMGVV